MNPQKGEFRETHTMTLIIKWLKAKDRVLTAAIEAIYYAKEILNEVNRQYFIRKHGRWKIM